MAYLNPKACSLIATALRDAATIFDTLVETQVLPPRMKSEFAQQRHMAEVLAELFDKQPAINVEAVNPQDYRALIWVS